MPHYAGLDVSKHNTSICVRDPKGEIVEEGVTETTAKAVAAFLRGKHRRYALLGLEATRADWFVAGLQKARFNVVEIDAAHAHAVLKEKTNKTDCNDARGIAELLRLGAHRPVHSKSPYSRRLRAMLGARSLALRRLMDIEKGLIAVLGECGQSLNMRRRKHFMRGARLAARGDPQLAEVVACFAPVHQSLQLAIAQLDRQVVEAAEADPICQRLMTAPGVGPITALTFRAAVDDPARFAHSRDVGAHFGLAPRTYQSGSKEWRGHIPLRGDKAVRQALHLAARSLLSRRTRTSGLQVWGQQVAARRGGRKACVAVARRLAVTLHRMWADETEFRWPVSSE